METVEIEKKVKVTMNGWLDDCRLLKCSSINRVTLKKEKKNFFWKSMLTSLLLVDRHLVFITLSWNLGAQFVIQWPTKQKNNNNNKTTVTSCTTFCRWYPNQLCTLMVIPYKDYCITQFVTS